jgi:hypothetical protein
VNGGGVRDRELNEDPTLCYSGNPTFGHLEGLVLFRCIYIRGD